MPDKNSSPEVRPLSDRRYLPRGPVVPYRGTELFLLFLDLAVIFFAIKTTEMIYSHTKGDRLIKTEMATQAQAREAESLMLTTRTAKRDSLRVVETQVIEARHADSLRIAELDTTFNLLVAVIEQGSVAVQGKRAEMEKAAKALGKKKTAQGKVEAKFVGSRKRVREGEGRVAAYADSFPLVQTEIAAAEKELAVALSKRPEVVVPATASASIGTAVSEGQVFSSVGLGKSFVNFGKTQLGLSASAGFGPERSSLSGGGLFINLPVIPNRASFDIGTGASVFTESGEGSDVSPYLSGSLRYSIRQGKRLYLMGDTRYSNDRLWTGIGLGIGR